MGKLNDSHRVLGVGVLHRKTGVGKKWGEGTCRARAAVRIRPRIVYAWSGIDGYVHRWGTWGSITIHTVCRESSFCTGKPGLVCARGPPRGPPSIVRYCFVHVAYVFECTGSYASALVSSRARCLSPRAPRGQAVCVGGSSTLARPGLALDQE